MPEQSGSTPRHSVIQPAPPQVVAPGKENVLLLVRPTGIIVEVAVSSFEFKAPLARNYFVTVQLKGNNGATTFGSRQRSEVAVGVPKPVFQRNRFAFECGTKALEQPGVELIVYEMLANNGAANSNAEGGEDESKLSSSAKLLSFARVPLAEHLPAIQSGSAVDVRAAFRVQAEDKGQKPPQGGDGTCVLTVSMWEKPAELRPPSLDLNVVSLPSAEVSEPESLASAEMQLLYLSGRPDVQSLKWQDEVVKVNCFDRTILQSTPMQLKPEQIKSYVHPLWQTLTGSAAAANSDASARDSLVFTTYSNGQEAVVRRNAIPFNTLHWINQYRFSTPLVMEGSASEAQLFVEWKMQPTLQARHRFLTSNTDAAEVLVTIDRLEQLGLAASVLSLHAVAFCMNAAQYPEYCRRLKLTRGQWPQYPAVYIEKNQEAATIKAQIASVCVSSTVSTALGSPSELDKAVPRGLRLTVPRAAVADKQLLVVELYALHDIPAVALSKNFAKRNSLESSMRYVAHCTTSLPGFSQDSMQTTLPLVGYQLPADSKVVLSVRCSSPEFLLSETQKEVDALRQQEADRMAKLEAEKKAQHDAEQTRLREEQQAQARTAEELRLHAEAEQARLHAEQAAAARAAVAEAFTEEDVQMYRQFQAEFPQLQEQVASLTETLRVAQDNEAQLHSEVEQLRAQSMQLQQEVANKHDAVKTCGVEIVTLRKQVCKLSEENHLLRARLSKEREVEDAQRDKLSQLPRDELIGLVLKFAQAHQTERRRRKAVEENAAQFLEQAKDRGELEEALRKLQAAHLAQSSHLQRLQDRKRGRSPRHRTQQYRETIRQQEQVIARLEELLESSLRPAVADGTAPGLAFEYATIRRERLEAEGSPGHQQPAHAENGNESAAVLLTSEELGDPIAALTLLKKQLSVQLTINRQLQTRLATMAERSGHVHAIDALPMPNDSSVPQFAAAFPGRSLGGPSPSQNAFAGKQVQELQAQLSTLQKQNEDLQQQLTSAHNKLASVGDGDGDGRDAGNGGDDNRWRFRAERAEERVSVIENQMEEVTRKAAKDISALKLKLQEKDMQLMGGFGNSLRLGQFGGETGDTSGEPESGDAFNKNKAAAAKPKLQPIPNRIPSAHR